MINGDDGVWIEEPWLNEPKPPAAKVEDTSKITSRSFKDSLNDIKETSDESLDRDDKPRGPGTGV